MNSIKSVGPPTANPFGDPDIEPRAGIRSSVPTAGSTTKAQFKDALAKQNDEAATQLEAYFLRTVMAETRANVDENSIDGGFAGGTFREMLDGALTDKMAAGHGVGLKKIIIESLERSQKGQEAGNRQPHDASEVGRIKGLSALDAIDAHRALKEK